MYKKWTDEEIEYLKNNYLSQPTIVTSNYLNRNKYSVIKKAKKLGLYKPFNSRNAKNFTKEEFLHAIKTSESLKEAGVKLGYKENKGCSFACSNNNKKSTAQYRFYIMLKELNPDLSHFKLNSRANFKNTTDIQKEDLALEFFYKTYLRSQNTKYRKDKNLKFDLSLEEFKKIVKQNCFYCGSMDNRTLSTHHEVKAVGVDRVDNKIGYTLNNCVPCCKMCNYIKHTFDIDIFLYKTNKISANHSGNF